MTLTGKDALEFYERIKNENRIKKVEEEESLARAKEEAALRDKEPFDLAKLETMCATEALGHSTPESRTAWFEKMYYLDHPEIMTLEQLARRITELGRWW
jgi:hypothetical protein